MNAAVQKPTPARQGTSLVEVSISTLLVGVVLVAALNCSGIAVKCTKVATEELSGEVYAYEMLAEIAAAAYHDPEAANANEDWGIEPDEPDPPTNRLAFDDVDDYDGWTEGSALAWRNGAARMDTAGWSRGVTVEKVSPTDVNQERADNSYDLGVRRVRVTVTSPTGEITRRFAYFSASGAMEQTPGADTTFITGVLIELQASGATSSGGTAVLNHATGP
ncbi:MAG: hypothetical protein AAGJ46_16030 [Planctomycetota bacterium]